MKKIICVFFTLVCLCSCKGEASQIKVVTQNISYEAHIFYNDKEYTLNVNCDESSGCSYLVTKPENLKDFTIVFSDSGVISKYKGLTYEPNLEALPYGGVMRALYEINTFLQTNDHTVIKENESYYIKGQISSGEFTLYVTAMGLPQSAQISDKNFRVEFYNVKLLN